MERYARFIWAPYIDFFLRREEGILTLTTLMREPSSVHPPDGHAIISEAVLNGIYSGLGISPTSQGLGP